MNYGYPKSSKDKKLAQALSKELGIPIGVGIEPSKKPYIEIDGLYEGVRIRRITCLSDKEQDVLTDKTDVIYRRILSKGR